MDRRRAKRLLARKLRAVLREDEWLRARLRGNPRNRERDARGTLEFTRMMDAAALDATATR